MTKVLVFGASHVAQVSMAFYALRSRNLLPPDLHLDFVSAPGPVIGRLKVTGPYLRLLEKLSKWPDLNFPAETFNEWYDQVQSRLTALSGTDTLDLRTYDAVFYIGGQLLSQWHLIDKAHGSGAYSTACLDQLCLDLISRSDFHRCLKQDDAGIETCRILSSFEPIHSELLPDYAALRPGLGRFSATHDLLRASAAKMGYEILAFPMELLNDAGNAVSVTYHNGKPDDYGHLNPQGGSHILRSMLVTVPGLAGADLPLLPFG
jgi:hypothetical protein